LRRGGSTPREEEEGSENSDVPFMRVGHRRKNTVRDVGISFRLLRHHRTREVTNKVVDGMTKRRGRINPQARRKPTRSTEFFFSDKIQLQKGGFKKGGHGKRKKKAIYEGRAFASIIIRSTIV